jgi:probable nitrogen fixation protein
MADVVRDMAERAAGPAKPLSKVTRLRAMAAAQPDPTWPDAPTFLPELAALIRAGDCCGLWDGKTDARLLKGYILSQEQRRAIPIVGNPDPRVLRRLHTFYHAVGTTIGRRSGHVATPLIDLSDEGFGRVVLIAGRLVAVSRTVRDVHRFGYDSLAALDAAGAALVEEGVGMIAAHPGLVSLDS